MRDVVDGGRSCTYSFVWRRAMEKFFKLYFGEHYTMAFFYQDTMICDMDRLCTSLCDNSKGLSHMFGWGGSTSSSIPQAGAKERRGYSSPCG